MKYRKLARTGTSVSNLALGAMEFGAKVEESDSLAILDRFVEAGGNLVDTANGYGAGTSEELLGRWFASRPADVTDRVVLATKARFGTGPDVNENGTGRRNLDRALSASLRRLGLERVDPYQVHGWDPLTPIEETLGFLDDAVRAGKIHYIGLSNFTGWQLQLTLSTAAAMGCQLPVTLQQQYSLVCRENEYEVIPAALHNDIGLLPWSPLASGFLTGKYERDTKPPSGARMGADSAFYNRTLRLLVAEQQNWDTLEAVRAIAASIGATPSQVALSWVTNQPSVTAPIIAASNLDQLEENLAGADLVLDRAATQRLDEVSAPSPDDYPYGPFGAKQRDRYVDCSDQVIRELT
ncbi:Aldo/keto reductase family protein [Friedmanniella luteola]|uniref:Aldo/keto reductase family protein n=1 Tax=Friedmanniella luteola TaxID=546871 RepID=A0A1H1U4B3_9ACTN|nr:aldo/keto reductase [Friedmanniella luteola]SDS67224.1 Aldo/keto reductase family protein [Friedmanniella luteola]